VHKAGLVVDPAAWGPGARTITGAGPGRNLGKSRGWLLSNVLGIGQAARALRPHVVHYHQPDVRPFYGRLAALAMPSLITLHSLAAFDPEAPVALTAMSRENLKRATMLVAVSDDVRAGLPADEARRTAVIPNGVDLAAFRRPQAHTPPRRLGTEAPVLLYVGRVTADKGVIDLLDAAVALRRDLPGARIVIAGPPVDLDVAAEAARAGLDPSAVMATGVVSTDALVELLHDADALVMPSRLREGQGRVIIEAMAAEVVVVATAVGAVPDLLEHGEAGLLVPAGDPAALADALVRLLGDPALQQRLVARATRVAARFDAATVARQVVEVYERAVAAGSRPPGDPVIP
jgi:glycosyltransferase involved in cell wall biosynthesis